MLFPADLADFRRNRMIISVNLRHLRNLRELFFRFEPILSFQIDTLSKDTTTSVYSRFQRMIFNF